MFQRVWIGMDDADFVMRDEGQMMGGEFFVNLCERGGSIARLGAFSTGKMMVNEVLFHAILGFQILDTEMCSRLSRFAISESNIYIYHNIISNHIIPY
jgi:hypothetical protein